MVRFGALAPEGSKTTEPTLAAVAMPGQPAPDDDPSTSNTAPAVKIDGSALRKVSVDGVENFGGVAARFRHGNVANGELLMDATVE